MRGETSRSLILFSWVKLMFYRYRAFIISKLDVEVEGKIAKIPNYKKTERESPCDSSGG